MTGVSPGMIPGLDSSLDSPDVPNNQLHEFSSQCSQASGEERKKSKVQKNIRIFKEPSAKASCLDHSNARCLQAGDSCIHRKRIKELDKLTHSIFQEKDFEAAFVSVDPSHRDRSLVLKPVEIDGDVEMNHDVSGDCDRNLTGQTKWVDGMVVDGTSSEGSENGDDEYDEEDCDGEDVVTGNVMEDATYAQASPVDGNECSTVMHAVSDHIPVSKFEVHAMNKDDCDGEDVVTGNVMEDTTYAQASPVDDKEFSTVMHAVSDHIPASKFELHALKRG
ncbi:hypothetical protein L2E82_30219 [Cichorium intybus]|uniref:Uncharacterized protein n=1 Tax=Cichorium intybus TaxID=13427 RepID=A0ACB9CZN5_CICIN|nr:hypothetical protein L2E82_30219 [Cichorium intybus]